MWLNKKKAKDEPDEKHDEKRSFAQKLLHFGHSSKAPKDAQEEAKQRPVISSPICKSYIRLFVVDNIHTLLIRKGRKRPTVTRYCPFGRGDKKSRCVKSWRRWPWRSGYFRCECGRRKRKRGSRGQRIMCCAFSWSKDRGNAKNCLTKHVCWLI